MVKPGERFRSPIYCAGGASPDGVADVFAFQNDGTVQAITSDGTVAWTANLNPDSGWLASAVPDFQGGLVAEIYSADGEQQSIMKFDGITGQPYPAYTAGGASSLYWNPPVVHPDGTIFVLQQNWTDADHDGVLPSTVVGIDPTTGVQKFSVPMEPTANTHSLQPLGLIIAGDGYAYVPYQNDENLYYTEDDHLRLLRVGVDGTYEDIDIFDSHQEMCCEMPPFPDLGVITNADQGVVLSWQPALSAGGRYLAVVQGGGVSVTSGPSLPTPWGVAIPVLQAQDGSFVGVWNGWDDDGNPVNDMLAFDASSNIRWIVPGNWQPRIATADGGVIATQMDDNYNLIGTVVFDQTGAATGMMAGLPTYSWKGAYQRGSVESILAADLASLIASSYAAVPGGNLTGNGFSLVHHTFGLVFCGPAPGDGDCVDPANPPVTFSYLAGATQSTYTFPPAVDFSAAHPNWVNTIKATAYNQYKAAFEKVPAIVARGDAASPLYGGMWHSPGSFEHTVRISGYWHPNNISGLTLPLSTSNSLVFYPMVMGNAQWGAAWAQNPDATQPIRPDYSLASSPPVSRDFERLMTSIGFAVGAVAAHETGWQLNLPNMECTGSGCPEKYIYEEAESGSGSYWFYGDSPGRPTIHFSQQATCALMRRLLGDSATAKYCH